MIRSMVKRIVPFLLSLLLLLALPLNAGAEDFDLGKTGSIRVQLRDVYFPDKSIGGTLTLHKVGEAQEVNSNLVFSLTGSFSGSGVSLSDLNASGLAQKLVDYAKKNNVQGHSAQANKNGYVTFSGLSAGLYLVMQSEAVDGYLPAVPFLVSLPMYSGESDSWIYSIDAAPKVQRPSREPVSVTVVKKWLDNNKNRPDSLTVNLLQEGEIVDTVVITAEDDWKYTWNNLNAYYSWTVKEVVPEGYKAEYSVYKDTTTITNKASWYVPPADVLIQTGQLNWPVPILVSAGLLLILVGCILLRRGKEDL